MIPLTKLWLDQTRQIHTPANWISSTTQLWHDQIWFQTYFSQNSSLPEIDLISLIESKMPASTRVLLMATSRLSANWGKFSISSKLAQIESTESFPHRLRRRIVQCCSVYVRLRAKLHFSIWTFGLPGDLHSMATTSRSLLWVKFCECEKLTLSWLFVITFLSASVSFARRGTIYETDAIDFFRGN